MATKQDMIKEGLFEEEKLKGAFKDIGSLARVVKPGQGQLSTFQDPLISVGYIFPADEQTPALLIKEFRDIAPKNKFSKEQKHSLLKRLSKSTDKGISEPAKKHLQQSAYDFLEGRRGERRRSWWRKLFGKTPVAPEPEPESADEPIVLTDEGPVESQTVSMQGAVAPALGLLLPVLGGSPI